MDDKKSTITKILETAILQEIKAKDFYLKMSAQLTNKESQSRFRHMAEAEQEHEDILTAWYEETCGYPFDVSKAQSKEYKLDIAEPEHNATFLDIVKLIAKVENKAFYFYKDAALLARTPEEKRMFERLASMEQMHADQSRLEVQIIANESLHFSEDDIPWKV
ncbi:MAG: ferritin family protein [Candidatus Brocadiales bacterium]|nr:ferritin family protein [Candidatus Brocadiales bacterium]